MSGDSVKPGTEAGRSLRELLGIVTDGLAALATVPTTATAADLDRIVVEVEAAARDAALREVEEAVAGLHRPGRSDVNYRAVTAAITRLRQGEST